MDRYAMFSSLFYRLYTLLWALARPFLQRNKRLADGWAERCVPETWAEPADVWIQAASGGEALLALDILDRMPCPDQEEGRSEGPVRILLTTWTRQGRDTLEEAQARWRVEKPWLHVAVRFAPLDTPRVATRAIQMVRPRLLLLLETELWPGLMGACAEAGVPVHVVNGRMSRASYEWYRMIRRTLRRLPLRRVYAISREDAERFARIFGADDATLSADMTAEFAHGAQPPHLCISVLPNIKFDRALLSLTRRKKVAAQHPVNSLVFGPFPIILLASVRRQEESLLARQLPQIQKDLPDALIIVAPRHMHRIQAWTERLYDMGLSPLSASRLLAAQECLRCKAHAVPVTMHAFSQNSASGLLGADPSDKSGESALRRGLGGRLIVWDRFGDLERLYGLASTVFVGGSFCGRGGQNFLEALAAGLVPCVGPSLENFRWALGEDFPPSLLDAGLLCVCSSPRKVGPNLVARVRERMAADRPEQAKPSTKSPLWAGGAQASACSREAVRQRFSVWLEGRTGASAKLAHLLLAAVEARKMC